MRVSQVRGREGDSFISPAVQRDKIVQWAALHDHEVGEVFEELDVSGAKPDREKLELALRRIERGQSRGLVVARLDRFGRSLVDGLAAIERIQRAGGIFASVADGFDISTDTGRLVLRIMLSLAEFELDRVRGSFADARARAVARGLHLSPVPPFGYTRPEDDAGHVTGPLVPDPRWGEVVSDLFERAARGEGWSSLARWLEEIGAPPTYAATTRTWRARTVKYLVRNRVYLGEARHGEFVNRGAHPALTDEPTFTRAQREGRRFPPSRSDSPALLSGLIRCAGCRHGMQSYFARNGRAYRCRKVYAAGRCPAPAFVLAKVIEPFVERAFFAAVGSVRSAPRIEDPDLDELTRRLRTAERELAAFRDSVAIVSTLGAEDFAAGVAVRRDALERAREAYETRQANVDRVAAIPALDLRAGWPSLEVEEKRELLTLAIDAVFVRRGRRADDPIADFAHVCRRGEAPVDLPRRGRPLDGRGIRSFVFPQKPAETNPVKRFGD